MASMIAIAFSARVAFAATLPGDINDDGKVDGLDIVLIAKYWGSAQGDGRYDAQYDLNGDNKIDGADIAVIAAEFGNHE
jgi:hypothetical protein